MARHPGMLALVLLLSPLLAQCQFPAICNTQDNLDSKTCCPNNCGGAARGSCVDITQDVLNQWSKVDRIILNLLYNTPTIPGKGTADSRFLWPTVVFENVCTCNGHYGGFDCMECDYGWTGDDCSTRTALVRRRPFNNLSEPERQSFINATRDLKNEMGRWSVIVEEPPNYSSGTVTLQNATTFNFFVHLHSFVTRDFPRVCFPVNDNNIIDFAHAGPAFPVWHRRYLLVVEREFQRIMEDPNFGLPYWQWEENDRSPFSESYYGVPSNDYSHTVNVTGNIFSDWYSVCDLYFQNPALRSCTPYWLPCNPANDAANRNPLQRGGVSRYLPNKLEVMIAIAAPSYDTADENGQYLINVPRASFRGRLEGLNRICSAEKCVARYAGESHMHNVVHEWVGGHMVRVPASVNDPIFTLHHCNVDRIFESWMKRFTSKNTPYSNRPPDYVPVSGGHPGHNRDDYLVPFFPLIKAGKQYGTSEEWGYVYDQLVPADIDDGTIADCPTDDDHKCAMCDSNATCINCDGVQGTDCSVPHQKEAGDICFDDRLHAGLGAGIAFGIPLLLWAAVATVCCIKLRHRQKYVSVQ